MAQSNLLYRFPSSQSSSPIQEVRYSWPDYQHVYQSGTGSLQGAGRLSSARQISAGSTESFSSSNRIPLRVTNENVHPLRAASDSSYRSASGRLSVLVKPSGMILPRTRSDQDIEISQRVTKTSSAPDTPSPCQSSYDIPTEEAIAKTSQRDHSMPRQDHIKTETVRGRKTPFRRWMKSVRQKSPARREPLKAREERWSLDDFDENGGSEVVDQTVRHHRKSRSMSSAGLITAVKSATASIAAPPTNSKRQSALLRRSKRSSRFSDTSQSTSAEYGQLSPAPLDEAGLERARQRRSTIDEIVSSEESYLADLKVLVNVYFTLLESASRGPQQQWEQIHRNMKEIMKLHEDLLSQIQQVVQNSDARCPKTDPREAHRSKLNLRRSQDLPQIMVAETATPLSRRSIEVSGLMRSRKATTASEPLEAVEVARVFEHLMTRFFVYEEYGAKYESMLRDMATASKNIPNWHAYERGIEALANSLMSSSSRGGAERKGLTLEDLLIKPIQRVCKYPLLFADLYKHTSIVDGLDARAEIEKVLCRLRETTQEINKATNDRGTRLRMQRSWQLQDMLELPDGVVTAPTSLRNLGHAILCGVLYVAYRSRQGLRGSFMLCALFKSYLLIAAPASESGPYKIRLIVNLSSVRDESSDSGRGLQCHTVPYAWKIIFENEDQLYEVILCACSSQEEEQWRSRVAEFSIKEGQRQAGDNIGLPPFYAVLDLNIKSIGRMFREASSGGRQLAIQRAATIPRSANCQVIIRNTNALKDHHDVPSDSMGRSQSLLANNRVPTLAPKRSDRTRMEHQLAGVWTRELLPYPGMTGPRNENTIRSSANSVLRRLRAASFGSTKHPASVSSFTDNGSVYIPTGGSPREATSPSKSVASSRRPKLQSSKSYDAGAKGSPRVQNAQGLKRSLSTAGTRIFAHNKRTREPSAINFAAQGDENDSSEAESVGTVKTKPTVGSGLRTNMSIEGIRSWFSIGR